MLAFARPISVRLYPLVRRARMVRVSKLAASDSFALGRCAVRLAARPHMPPAAEIVCGKPAWRTQPGLWLGQTIMPWRTPRARYRLLGHNRRDAFCCGAYVSYWHNATFCCDASILSLLDAKRTSRERRERADVTRLTHLGRGWPFFAAMHGAIISFVTFALG
jgi:hypothetical protein